MKNHSIFLFLLCVLLSLHCNRYVKDNKSTPGKFHVIFDTDANNELDDQHALAYLLFNGDIFHVEGVTVNATYSGGDIHSHFAEAERIIKLCGLEGKIPLFRGANKNFPDIESNTGISDFDGRDAVNFIIEKANSVGDPIVLVAVGKLTNVALALKKDPSIIPKVKVVWLGSNYPEPGEYNQDNDTMAMSYVLNTDVKFEMVTVRYGQPSGTDAVKVTKKEINERMPGKGPRISMAVIGRHHGAFNTFGDYSVNLFENIRYYGNPPSRALFDMAAVAILKNPSWANSKEIPCPVLKDKYWEERPTNKRKIILWENFDRNKIVEDFFYSMEHYKLVGK